MVWSSPWLINGVGVAAALCSMASFIPQAVKIIKARDCSSVSLSMYIVTVIGFALWTAYGVLMKSWPLVGSNLVSFALAALILGLKLFMPQKRSGQAVAAEPAA